MAPRWNENKNVIGKKSAKKFFGNQTFRARPFISGYQWFKKNARDNN